MKSTKVLAVGTALALAVGCTGTAFAAAGSGTLSSVTDPGNTQQLTVTGEYSNDTEIGTVYSVDLAWDDMTFTYSTEGTMTWDPEDHTYSSSVVNDGTWTAADGGTSAGVTATNHSNAPVNINFTFSKNNATEGSYAGSMSVASDQLTAGVENDYANADSVDSELSFTGALGGTYQGATTAPTLGTVTISLSAVQ